MFWSFDLYTCLMSWFWFGHRTYLHHLEWLDIIYISVFGFQGTIVLEMISKNSDCFEQSSETGNLFWSLIAIQNFFKSGSHLSSHTVTSIVLSAAKVLTVVFEMGTGVSPKRIATRNVLLLRLCALLSYSPVFILSSSIFSKLSVRFLAF